MEQLGTKERHAIRLQVIKDTFNALPVGQQRQLVELKDDFSAILAVEGLKGPGLGIWGFLEIVCELSRIGALR